MRRSVTIEDIRKSACGPLNPHLDVPRETEDGKKAKYRNSKTIVDDIQFHSKKEAKRYVHHMKRLKRAEIGLLRMQVEYELNPGGEFSYKYIADFVYIESLTGEEIVEDVKGMKTREYKKKKKLMKEVYNIDIKET